MEKYINRSEAGKVLGEFLQQYAHNPDAIVLALPRGGVPVAYRIAERLILPLDVLIVRKLGVPGHEELAMGAIASGGVVVYNDDIIHKLAIPKKIIDSVIAREKMEMARRETKYRGSRPFPDLTRKIIILVDDGIATGATIRAAIQSLRTQNVARIVVAVPVAAEDTCRDLIPLVDELVCPLRPEYFNAVGAWYEVFEQTSDREVIDLMTSR